MEDGDDDRTTLGEWFGTPVQPDAWGRYLTALLGDDTSSDGPIGEALHRQQPGKTKTA